MRCSHSPKPRWPSTSVPVFGRMRRRSLTCALGRTVRRRVCFPAQGDSIELVKLRTLSRIKAGNSVAGVWCTTRGCSPMGLVRGKCAGMRGIGVLGWPADVFSNPHRRGAPDGYRPFPAALLVAMGCGVRTSFIKRSLQSTVYKLTGAGRKTWETKLCREMARIATTLCCGQPKKAGPLVAGGAQRRDRFRDGHCHAWCVERARSVWHIAWRGRGPRTPWLSRSFFSWHCDWQLPECLHLAIPETVFFIGLRPGSGALGAQNADTLVRQCSGPSGGSGCRASADMAAGNFSMYPTG